MAIEIINLEENKPSAYSEELLIKDIKKVYRMWFKDEDNSSYYMWRLEKLEETLVNCYGWDWSDVEDLALSIY